MRRGFKCRRDVLSHLEESYDSIVHKDYGGDYLGALKNFDYIAEEKLRRELIQFYENPRSRDQAWKTCKGSLYEYAVFKYIRHVIQTDNILNEYLDVFMGDDVLNEYQDQIVIRNWCDIYPDADLIIVNKKTNTVKAIISCKTSLRERLTETAFWKRELERSDRTKDVKIFFITTDKDEELKTETNRYILLHVIDQTFITDEERYYNLINSYKRKYGERSDFETLIHKVRLIDEIKVVLKMLI